MPSLQAGLLRHRVTIQSYAQLLDSNGLVIQDETGAVSRGWVDIAEVWAAINPLSVREFIQSAATQSEVTTRITIRYLSTVQPDMRVVHGVRLYKIEGVLPDPDSGLEYISLACSEGVGEGE